MEISISQRKSNRSWARATQELLQILSQASRTPRRACGGTGTGGNPLLSHHLRTWDVTNMEMCSMFSVLHIYSIYIRNSTWSWAKSIWFGVPILARIIIYICNVHWVGDLNLYSIHWLLGDLSVKLIWRSTITILHICKYVWCPLSWGPKYSFDMVYVDFLVAYYCLARTPEVLIPNLMQAEKVIL